MPLGVADELEEAMLGLGLGLGVEEPEGGGEGDQPLIFGYNKTILSAPLM